MVDEERIDDGDSQISDADCLIRLDIFRPTRTRWRRRACDVAFAPPQRLNLAVRRTRWEPLSRMRSAVGPGDALEGAVDEDPGKLAWTDLSIAAAHLLGELDELPPAGFPKGDEPLDSPSRVRGAPAGRPQALRYVSPKLQEIEGAAAWKIRQRDDAACAECLPYAGGEILLIFSHRQTP